jgi:hypothetical protein
MKHIIGSGYFGSATPTSSVGNDELIQQHKPSSFTSFSTYRFEFANVQACAVKINGATDAIWLNANQGFTSRHYDAPISTFVVVTPSVQHTYIGRY